VKSVKFDTNPPAFKRPSANDVQVEARFKDDLDGEEQKQMKEAMDASILSARKIGSELMVPSAKLRSSRTSIIGEKP